MKITPESAQNLRLLIIGGVAAGASAAARARRLSESAQITLIERGPDVSFANCGLPYHIGGEIADRERLAVQTPASLNEMLNIEVLPLTEAIRLDRAAKSVTLRDVRSGVERVVPYDKLLLAPGASPLRPPLPGIDDPRILTLRNLQDMDRIKQTVATAQRVAIIGAGFIGLEMAEQLARLGKQVEIVELQQQVLPQLDPEMTHLIAETLAEHGVGLRLGDGIKGFQPSPAGVGVELASGATLQADAVILSIGVRPEATLAREAGLQLGERGHIAVDEFLRTSDPDIYAAGDAVETIDGVLDRRSAIPLGGPANRQGRLVADHIFSPETTRAYPGSIGTAIVRVFETVAGMTGWSEKRLRAEKVEVQSTIITDYQHAGYFPGAQQLSLKIIWDAADGRLLGAQVTGTEGVDKRIDVLATAIRARMTVEDLANLELAYAPPFSSAKDPVNVAGLAASNLRAGLVESIYEIPSGDGVQIVDVRPQAMADLHPLPGARCIPLPQLRSRLGELDRHQPVATVCALGKTSYFAARILRQNGFQVRSVSGGLRARRDFLAPVLQRTAPQPTRTESAPAPQGNLIRLDATGIACPGPILRVKEACAKLAPGDILEVMASDGGFSKDLPAFCAATGHEFLGVEKQGGVYMGKLRQPTTKLTPAIASAPSNGTGGATLVVFSQEMDRALGALVIANGALAMGGSATLFFTFWGLNVLRKEQPPLVEGKSFMDKMFGWMMPRGMDRLPLSNMHMAGMGTRLMKWRMASKNLPNLPGLLAEARQQGARIVACSMSMEAMGIRQEELIDGVEIGGVADFLGAAAQTRTNLFI